MRIVALLIDEGLISSLPRMLVDAGHRCRCVSDWQSMQSILRQSTRDLLLIEVGSNACALPSPKLSAALCGHGPLVTLSSELNQPAIDQAFETGAKDCILLPSDAEYIMLRIHVALKRAYENHFRPVFRQGPYRVDIERRRITLADQVLKLTWLQFEIARCFLADLQRPLSRDYLYERVYGLSADPVPRTIDAEISLVRHKLNLDQAGYAIRSIYNFGYRFDRLTTRAPCRDGRMRSGSSEPRHPSSAIESPFMSLSSSAKPLTSKTAGARLKAGAPINR